MRKENEGAGSFPGSKASEKLRLAVLAVQHEGSRRFGTLTRDYELTRTQAEILAVVEDFGPLSLKELGELVVCESGSPSRATDDLVRRGYLSRSRDGLDRRRLNVDITPGGKVLLAAVADELRGMHERVRAALTEPEMANIATALALIIEGTEEHSALMRRFVRLDGIRPVH